MVNLDQLTLTESLKDTIARVVPYFEREIKPQMGWGRRIIMAAHGSFLRTLVKYFEDLTPEQILEVNIPTGVPLVYEFERDFRVVHKQYLGNAEAIVAKINSVANQGRQNVP